MVRRLKVESDQRQLGLFGDGLALGVRPAVVRVLPNVELVRDLPRRSSSVVTISPQSDKSANPRKLSSLPPEIVRPPEAASFLSVSLSLLKKWRLSGGGPRFVRLGGRAIGYRRGDLLDWIAGLTR